MFQKLFQLFLQKFVKNMGRGPQNPAEWMQIQDQAIRHLNKTKGTPSITKNIPGEPKITIDDLLKGPVRSKGPKGDRIWDFSKKQKKGDVVDLFATEKEFGDDLYSIGQNLIKNDPMFNLDLATTFRNPGTKTYSAHGSGKLHSPSQRQKILDKLKGIMKHDTYQAQHAEELGFVDLTDDIFTIEKASGGRVPFFKGKIAKGILSLGKKKKFRPSLEQRRHNARLMGEKIKPTKEEFRKKAKYEKLLREKATESFYKNWGIDRKTGLKIEKASGGRIGRYGGGIAPLVGEPTRTPMEKGKKAKKKKKKKKAVPEELPPYQGSEYETDDPKEAAKKIINLIIGSGIMSAPIGGGFGYGVGYGEDRPFDYGIGYGSEDGGLYADYGIRDDGENVYSGGYHGDDWGIGVRKEEGGDPYFTFKKKFNQGGRIGMAGGGALFKFIEMLFIKASNQIRQGKGKWKGLDQKQRIVQHDNLTKKVVEFQKTGNTEGLEVYFGVNPNEAFAAASQKATRLGKRGPHWKKQEVQAQADETEVSGIDDALRSDFETMHSAFKGMDERTALKQKYPGVTDDLIEKILIDDNPQRKAEVLATMDEYLKLREVGKGEEEAYEIMVKSIKDPTRHAEGGRAGYIFGGSAGLKALWRQMLGVISKSRGEKITKMFPRLSVEEKELVRKGEKYLPRESKTWSVGEREKKVEAIDLIINRLKSDKDIIVQQAKNKAMKDEGLDFVMKHLEKDMPEVYGPHLKKYTNIDKDILQMENIKKNLIMKDRKLNAEGGRIGYAGGGKTGLPAVTMGTPQMNMQQPQMPAGPQPAGIPGGTIVAQNQMQQSPWMGSQMPQPGGMPKPGGMPRPMAAEGGRIGFGLGGFNKARRAFLKLMAGVTAGGVAAGTGLLKFGKAAKVVPKVTETITRGADGMPVYVTDLIQVVKAKGTKDIIEGFKRSDYSTVHSYKGVEVIEDAAGNTKIKSDLGGVATDPHTGKMHEGIAQEHHMQIDKGEWIEPTKTKKGIKTHDEYVEGTVRPDMDGKMKDFEDGLDEAVHLEFKKIADEVDTLIIKKASGGLAYALGE